MYSSLDPTSFQPWIDTNSASFKSTEFVWNEVYCNLPAAAKQSAARRDMLLMQATERLVESARFRYFHHSLTYKPHMYSAKRIWSMRFLLRQKMYNTQSNAKHLLFHFETENTTPEFDIANKPGTMMPCMTSLPNKGAQTRKCLQIGINQKKKSERSEWFRTQNKFDIMMAWTTPCFTAFLRCPYRIEQYLQRSNTWLLMQHVRHEQFPQANSGANSFVYAANDSKKKQVR